VLAALRMAQLPEGADLLDRSWNGATPIMKDASVTSETMVKAGSGTLEDGALLVTGVALGFAWRQAVPPACCRAALMTP
jgi:hypothetical protein